MRWATFDCFGTLIDWRHGIATSLDLILPGQGTRLLDAYIRHEPAVQAELPGLRYREVMVETLSRALDQENARPPIDDLSVLAATLPYWPVFPEVRTELTALRAAGWRLALLTNCDRDLIALTRRRLEVPFDAVVTSEDVGAYKPAEAHFVTFRESFEPDRWVHVAQSYTHDLVPAHRLGIRRVWINRRGERPADPAIVQDELPTLHGLAGVVAA
jgi:2-haloacid dehalogenase